MSFRGFRTAATTAMLAMGIMAVQARAQIQFTQTIDTTAGTGANSNTGDGGPGIAALVSNGIHLMAADRQGNVYFAESGARIRKIFTSGIIQTIAGGTVEGGEIVCPRHGARFCLRTGQALTPPAYEPIRVFETKISDGRLWVRSD